MIVLELPDDTLEFLLSDPPDLQGKVLYRSSGDLIRANRGFRELLKVSEQELRGTPIWEIDRDLTRDQFEQWWASFEVGEIRDRQTRFRRSDGITVSMRVLSQKIKVNETEHLVETVRVPEREEDGERTERADSMQPMILESVSVGILVLNRDSRVELCNRKFTEMWDVPVSLLVGSKSHRTLIEHMKHQLREPRKFVEQNRVMEQRREEEFTDLLEFKDGRIFERTARPYRVRGEHAGRVFSYRDITERKQAQENLRESEERFRQLAENIEEAFWLLDAEADKFIYFSPVQMKLWGRSLAPFYNNPGKILEITHPDDRERMEDFLASLNTSLDTKREVEHRIQRPDGSTIWLRTRAFPVKNKEGVVYRIAGICEEITDLKQLHEQLRHQAFHDELTDLPTRGLFRDRLNQNFKRMQRVEDYDFALFFVDVDDLKSINDTYGHDAGDQVLRLLAKRLAKTVRSPDTVARYGGDEFLILTEGTSTREEALQVVDRLRDALRDSVSLTHPETGQSIPMNLNVSLGVSLTRGAKETEDPEQFIRQADQAMYEAKRRGEFYAVFESEERNQESST